MDPKSLQGILSNPLLMMGLGMLGGNQGVTKGAAFSNAMRGGLGGAVAGQRSSMLGQLTEAQIKKLTEETMRRERAADKQRQAQAMMASSVYQSASPDEQRSMLSTMFPAAAAQSMLSQSPEQRDYMKARTVESLANAATAGGSPSQKLPMNLIHPMSGDRVTVRPEDPRVDDYLAQGYQRVGMQMQGTPDQLFPGTKRQMGTAVAEMGFMEDLSRELDRWITNIQQDPSLVGPSGAVRGLAQKAIGMTEDASALVSPGFANSLKEFVDGAVSAGVTDDLPAQERRSLFTDPDIPQRTLFQNRLGLALARLQYGEGRIPVEVIRRSIDDAKLTGMTSSREVLSKYGAIRDRLNSHLEQLNWRLTGGSRGRVEQKAVMPGTGEPAVKIGGTWYKESEAKRLGLIP